MEPLARLPELVFVFSLIPFFYTLLRQGRGPTSRAALVDLHPVAPPAKWEDTLSPLMRAGLDSLPLHCLSLSKKFESQQYYVLSCMSCLCVKAGMV